MIKNPAQLRGWFSSACINRHRTRANSRPGSGSLIARLLRVLRSSEVVAGTIGWRKNLGHCRRNAAFCSDRHQFAGRCKCRERGEAVTRYLPAHCPPTPEPCSSGGFLHGEHMIAPAFHVEIQAWGDEASSITLVDGCSRQVSEADTPTGKFRKRQT